jgi:hypothetical protein
MGPLVVENHHTNAKEIIIMQILNHQRSTSAMDRTKISLKIIETVEQKLRNENDP